MGIVRKTILYVLAPIFVVMLGVAIWYHLYGSARAEESANRRLRAAAELASRLIVRHVDELKQALESIVVQGHLQQYHMYSQVGLLDEAEDSRLWVEQGLEHVAQVNHVHRIECYMMDGDRFIAIVDGRRVLVPANATDEPWFTAALMGDEHLSFHSTGMLRLAETRSPDYSDTPIAVVAIVFDFRDTAAKATQFATRHLNDVNLSVVSSDHTIQFQQGSLSHSKEVLQQETSIDRLQSTLLVQQTKTAALADFYHARNILFTALAIVTVGLLVVSAIGTHQVVKDLREANRRTDQANRKLNRHAKELEAAHKSLEVTTDELAVANTQLENSNIQLQRFAYVASHDLQAPLRGIAGFAQLLRNRHQGKLDETADDYLDRIVEGVKRMQALINDLLAYSRVEAQAAPFEPTSLNGVIDDTLKMLRSSIEDAGAEVTSGELPTVAGDHAQLSQLMQNLISNGLKFSSDHAPRVRVSAKRNDNEWTIAVRDNGIGISPKHHEHIFEIFRRLHSQDEYPGTGIGLAICRQIVNRHGGQIWVESEPDRGCTFKFTLPAG